MVQNLSDSSKQHPVHQKFGNRVDFGTDTGQGSKPQVSHYSLSPSLNNGTIIPCDDNHGIPVGCYKQRLIDNCKTLKEMNLARPTLNNFATI